MWGSSSADSADNWSQICSLIWCLKMTNVHVLMLQENPHITSSQRNSDQTFESWSWCFSLIFCVISTEKSLETLDHRGSSFRRKYFSWATSFQSEGFSPIFPWNLGVPAETFPGRTPVAWIDMCVLLGISCSLGSSASRAALLLLSSSTPCPAALPSCVSSSSIIP